MVSDEHPGEGTTMSDTTGSGSKHWIVGVDGSPDARAALQWAARMAAERNERVTPVAGWHLPLALVAMAGRRGGDVDRVGMRAEAAVAAETTVASIETHGVVYEPLVEEGHPAPLLLDRSTRNTVTVVGRRGISELKHRLLGSVSLYLATHAEGPTVVVPSDWDRACSRIVVGFDGSDHAAAALQWALDLATDDCEVIALIAIDVAPWLSFERAAERYGDLIEAAEQRITEAADAVDPLHRAERLVVAAGPRHAFAEVLEDADLVVVGPRGLGGLARTMLGSVTTWLLSTASCPVAVVPSIETDEKS